jgi:hypothetical protein
MIEDQSAAIEDIYDCIMDLVLEAREVTLKNTKDEGI